MSCPSDYTLIGRYQARNDAVEANCAKWDHHTWYIVNPTCGFEDNEYQIRFDIDNGMYELYCTFQNGTGRDVDIEWVDIGDGNLNVAITGIHHVFDMLNGHQFFKLSRARQCRNIAQLVKQGVLTEVRLTYEREEGRMWWLLNQVAAVQR